MKLQCLAGLLPQTAAEYRIIIAYIGLPSQELCFDQPARKLAITKNNWHITTSGCCV